jgi:phosphoenolpyruvate carboxykinase (ATP)
MKLTYTRAMVSAAINGALKNVQYEEHPIFRVLVPKSCPSIPEEILNPINTWENKNEYDRLANELAEKFNKNFEKFNKNFEKFKNVSDEIRKAAPIINK